ncbi:DUF411 domain-containing protein [Spongiibacter nanhainus]|uniref:DUF411 domain-containing protein n=1 Tax=Spongiibacter nanhainus TaxID=2794344 RepID=A0A7T4R426_9GAMM|nr:DUF411 domain-containing protein [Spongiibacter nanhainus]
MLQQLRFSLPLILALLATSATADTLIRVSKSPTCGCCTEWVEHLRDKGFEVEARNRNDMHTVKAALGIAPRYASCHTATVGDYVIEGHVPAADVKRLLAEKPDALGLTVPGMPVGSPGMEMGDRVDNYSVLLLKRNGSSEVFSRHPQNDTHSH